MPAVAILAGAMFAVSAKTAQGTELRAGAQSDLRHLVNERSARIVAMQEQVAGIQAMLDRQTDIAAQANADVAQATSRAEPLIEPAGLTALTGPGLVVTLDDADSLPSGAPTSDLNALVVHQSDVQAVVNALWAGGAEAVSLMDQRLVATSAVRCVGNTLLLGGRVYSPPFVVKAIGPADGMRTALNRSPGVLLFLQAAKYLGLGYTVAAPRTVAVPAYAGPVGLQYAEVSGR